MIPEVCDAAGRLIKEKGYVAAKLNRLDQALLQMRFESMMFPLKSA